MKSWELASKGFHNEEKFVWWWNIGKFCISDEIFENQATQWMKNQGYILRNEGKNWGKACITD